MYMMKLVLSVFLLPYINKIIVRTLLLFVVCTVNCTQVLSQDTSGKNDSLTVELLYTKGIEIINSDPVEARETLENALSIINKNLSSHKEDNNDFLLKKAFIVERLAYFSRRENEYEMALKYLQESLRLKDKVNETYTLAYTYSQIAWLWIYQSEFEETKINLDSAYALSKKYNNVKEKIRTLSRFGTLYLNTKEYNKAEKKHLRAVTLADSIDDTRAKATTNANYADFLRRQKRYKESVPYLQKSMDMHKETDNLIGVESGYYALGVTYRSLGEPYKAIAAFKRAINMSEEQKNESILHTRYFFLSKSYEDIKDYKRAYSSYKKFHLLKEKGKNETNYMKMTNLESKYKYEQQAAVDSLRFASEKREVELIAKTESSKKRLYFILLFVSVIGAVIIAFLIRRDYQRRTKMNQEAYEHEKRILDQEIAAKEGDIKRLIADNSMRLAFKEELLDKLRTDIAIADPENIKQSLQSLTTQLRLQIETESKLSGLQEKIEVVNKGFDTRLKEQYPSLTTGEREVCALLRLNLSIKEIMTIRNVSIDSVKSMRHRIRKKMDISQEVGLENFIQGLS